MGVFPNFLSEIAYSAFRARSVSALADWILWLSRFFVAVPVLRLSRFFARFFVAVPVLRRSRFFAGCPGSSSRFFVGPVHFVAVPVLRRDFVAVPVLRRSRFFADALDLAGPMSDIESQAAQRRGFILGDAAALPWANLPAGEVDQFNVLAVAHRQPLESADAGDRLQRLFGQFRMLVQRVQSQFLLAKRNGALCKFDPCMVQRRVLLGRQLQNSPSTSVRTVCDPRLRVNAARHGSGRSGLARTTPCGYQERSLPGRGVGGPLRFTLSTRPPMVESFSA